MKKFMNSLTGIEGQGMVEYALIMGLVGVFVVVIMVSIGPQIKDMAGSSTSDDAVGKGQAEISATLY